MQQQALAEDATVFDYDGVYDSIQAERVQPKQAEKLARKSRYIEGLMRKAEERKKEEDIVYERRCGCNAALPCCFITYSDVLRHYNL